MMLCVVLYFHFLSFTVFMPATWYGTPKHFIAVTSCTSAGVYFVEPYSEVRRYQYRSYRYSIVDWKSSPNRASNIERQKQIEQKPKRNVTTLPVIDKVKSI